MDINSHNVKKNDHNSRHANNIDKSGRRTLPIERLREASVQVIIIPIVRVSIALRRLGRATLVRVRVVRVIISISVTVIVVRVI